MENRQPEKHTCVVEKKRKPPPKPKHTESIFSNCGPQRTARGLLFRK